MTIPSIPPELELKRCNDTPDITAAASVVDQYIPIPDFKPEPSPGYSTTIVSAFFPPPQAEVLVRRMGGDPFTRDPDEYVQALKLMARICKKLVLFVPPGCMAEDLRAAAPDVIVYDHYRTVWDMPHLAPHQDEFYTHQPTRSLHGGCRNPTNLYGEPHSWGAWNAKAFLILEALRLDPFRTSHFVWMDARVPSFIPRSHTADWIWPHPEALERAHSVMPAEDRVVLSTMRPLRPPGAEYWPRLLADGTKMDAYMSDLHAVVANVYFGAKAAMARLARAQLILMQRDLARGYFVGREEYQLSYLHFEFSNLTYTLDLFSQTYPPGVDWYNFTYWYMGVPGHDWRGLGLDKDPVLSSENTQLFLSLDPVLEEPDTDHPA